MKTPVDMLPLFWLLVVTPLLFVGVMLTVGWLLTQPAKPADRDALVIDQGVRDGEECPACGYPVDHTGWCGCSLSPLRVPRGRRR